MVRMNSRWAALTVVVLLAGTLLCSCRTLSRLRRAKADKTPTDIDVQNFGKTPEGEQVRLYSLTNANGLKAQVMTYGAIVTSLEVPDRKGQMDDIVLGYDNLQDYIKETPYFGAIVGRYGNRIAKGKFCLLYTSPSPRDLSTSRMPSSA